MTVNKKNTPELLTFLAGLTFFCASLELLVPKFVPFFRLGLANAVLLIATTLLDIKLFCLLLLLKVLGQAVISGTLFSYVFVFSFAGTFASGILSYGLAHIMHNKISFIGISCAGAFASNAVQLLLAYFFVFGKATLVFAPPVLLIGLLTSIPLGVFVLIFTESSEWYKSFFLLVADSIEDAEKTEMKAENFSSEKKSAQNQIAADTSHKKKFIAKLIVTVILFSGMIITREGFVTVTVFFLSVLLCAVSKIKVNVRNFFIFSFSVLLAHIFQVDGKLLFEIFKIKITSGALLAGLQKIAFFQSMLFFSKWISATPVAFSGRFGFLLSKSFENFHLLLSNTALFDKKNVLKSLDMILLRCSF